MRILHIIQRFYPYIGGSEGYFKEISERFVRDGDHVDVFTTDAWDLEHFWAKGKKKIAEPESDVNGVRVRRFPVRHTPLCKFTYPVQRRAMAELSRLGVDLDEPLRLLCRNMPLVPSLASALARSANGYDIVHVTNIPFDSLIYTASRFAREHGIPWVITPFTHLGEPGNEKVRRYYSMRHQIGMMREANAIIVQTDLERDFLAGRGIPALLMHKVGVGVNVEDVVGGNAGRFRLSYRITNPIVFYLGTMAYDKGTQHLVEAMRLLWREGVAADLVLAGPTMEHFTRYLESLEPEEKEHVHMLGFISDEVKRDLLAAGDVFAMPSRTDSFGIVYLESWLYSKPVIGALAGGVPEVVDDGVNGYLAPFGDTKAIAERIRLFLDDRDLAQGFGEAGRRKVLERYTWDRQYGRIRDIYIDVIERHNRARD